MRLVPEISTVAAEPSPTYPAAILINEWQGGIVGSGDVVTLIVVVVGAVFVLLSVFLPSMMKMRARGGGAAETSEATPAAHDRERAAMERIEQSVLQLEETSRELFGRLDTRARVLIRLIEEAEVKTRRIEELQARAKGTGQ